MKYSLSSKLTLGVISIPICMLAACSLPGITVPDVTADANNAVLIGSKYGKQVRTYTIEIDDKLTDAGTHYKRSAYRDAFSLAPGTHKITIHVGQCDTQPHIFRVNLEAGKIYVAQSSPTTDSNMETWISELGTTEAISDKFTWSRRVCRNTSVNYTAADIPHRPAPPPNIYFHSGWRR